MPWAHALAIDADKTDVGTVSSTFTDVDSTEFHISERVKLNVAGRDAYIAQAIAERNAWQSKKTTATSLLANLTSAMDAADT